MSSLAATQSDGYYYHPDYRKEDGSISKFNGSKGANQFEQRGVIRFEFPFDGWCLSCGARHSKGSRFNAKKEKDGKYLSTTVWSFSMKCTGCVQVFVIKTDPKNCTYDFAQGLRKRDEEAASRPSDGQLVITNFADESGTGRALAAVDPMERLMRDQHNKIRAATKEEQLEQLEAFQERTFHDSDANSVLRRAARQQRNTARMLLLAGADLGLPCALAEESPLDAERAKRMLLERVVVRPQRISGLGGILSEPLTFKRPAPGGGRDSREKRSHKSRKRERESGGTGGMDGRQSAHASAPAPTTTIAVTRAEAVTVSVPEGNGAPLAGLAMLSQYGEDD